jgi:hypothetical protein
MGKTYGKDDSIISLDDLESIGLPKSTELDDLHRAINDRVTFGCQLKATSPNPDALLNIGAISKVLADGRVQRLSPLKSLVQDFTGGSINVSTGATIGDINAFILPTAGAVSEYVTMGLALDSAGFLNVTFNTVGVVSGGDGAIPFPKTMLALGYIKLESQGAGTAWKGDGAASNVLENDDITQFLGAGGGGSGSGDSLAFEKEMDLLLNGSFYPTYTPIIFSRDEDDFVDGASTGAYSIVDEAYLLDSGEIFVSINMFGAKFISDGERSLKKIIVVDYVDEASRDDAAVYEVSINGGANWDIVPMVRQGETTRYIANEFNVTDQVAFQDLRIRITASANDKKLANIAVFYNEQLNGIVNGVINRQVFNFSGDDDITEFPITNFTPDSRLVEAYLVQSGQTFIYGAFSLGATGKTITFQAGDLLIPGEALTLDVRQLQGSSFDNSDDNGALMAANGLGSMDDNIDKSVAGQGIIQRDEITNKRNRFRLSGGILYIEELE